MSSHGFNQHKLLEFAYPSLTRSLVLLVLMLATAITALELQPQKSLASTRERINLKDAIPQSFGEWALDKNVSPVSVSPDQQETLDLIYDQIVSQTYVNRRGKRFMVSVAYGSAQTRQLRAHRQEVCYAAQGFSIRELAHPTLVIADRKISATRMVAVQGARTEPVTYWFTMGDAVVRSLFDRQWQQFRYATSGYIPDGFLFRVSSIDTDSEKAFRDQEEFIRELMDAIDSRLVERLVGREL